MEEARKEVMGFPDDEGFRIIGLIGSGGCGSVCSAEARDGAAVAVKYLEGLSVHRVLLARMTARLAAGGWPSGVMPVIEGDYDGRPALMVKQLHADVDAEGEIRPRSLQHRLEDHRGRAAWPLVRLIAAALSAMHAKGVPHGNLKPGNIFIDAKGHPLLTDWTLGNMPGVARFEFTDAVLYQAPEQLRDTGGYEEAAGYRWDVYAFGTLAFRLLAGRFPRCDETFSKVAPPPGEALREGVQADLAKIAVNLTQAGGITWPASAPDAASAAWREVIGRCLRLDPAERPATMTEVAAMFDAADERLRNEGEREELRGKLAAAGRRNLQWGFAAGISLAAAVILAGLWRLTGSQLAAEKRQTAAEMTSLRAAAASAEKKKAEALGMAEEAVRARDYEKDVSRARLEASRDVTDRLFTWAMEKGHRQLPPLDGRESRLRYLERYLDGALSGMGEDPELARERAEVRLQLAEISLATGDVKASLRRLEAAAEAWKAFPVDAEFRFRIGRDRLMVALLLQSAGDPRMRLAFKEARDALAAVPAAEVDRDRLRQLQAILDFHEAKFLAAEGNEAKALQQLMGATQALNRLAAERPDSAVIRSELAACYMASAAILEGMGNLGDAREVQKLAAAEIVRILRQSPGDPVLRADLAGCYAAIADDAVLAGDNASADAASAEALKILRELVREQPGNTDAMVMVAAQTGLRAGLMRDRGEGDAALRAFDEAIRQLEGIRASAPDHAAAAYRLALLWWQKGRMLGMAGKRAEEVSHIRGARDLLLGLEGGKSAGGPPVERIQTSTAYLLGDLGHAFQLAGRKEDARAAFSESAAYWERLLQARPKSEEYQESIAWCRQRIKELQ